MRRNSIIILLIIGALLSGCVGKESITGTYAQQYQDEFSKENKTATITFYDDGTWLLQSPDGGNSGVYQIHGKELVFTGQLVAGKFIILDNGSLMDPDTNYILKKK